MNQSTTIEFFLLVSADGEYGIGRDEDSAALSYENDIGELPAQTRMVKLLLTIPLPRPLEVSGTVPGEGGTVTLTVA